MNSVNKNKINEFLKIVQPLMSDGNWYTSKHLARKSSSVQNWQNILSYLVDNTKIIIKKPTKTIAYRYLPFNPYGCKWSYRLDMQEYNKFYYGEQLSLNL